MCASFKMFFSYFFSDRIEDAHLSFVNITFAFVNWTHFTNTKIQVVSRSMQI